MSITQTIVQNFLQYLTQRDLEKITNLFAEKIDWHIPGNEQKAAWLGKRNTRKEVADFFALLWQHTEPVAARIDHIFYDGDNAVIAAEFTTKMMQTGNLVDNLFFIQLEVDKEKIVRYRLLEDSYAVSTALI